MIVTVLRTVTTRFYCFSDICTRSHAQMGSSCSSAGPVLLATLEKYDYKGKTKWIVETHFFNTIPVKRKWYTSKSFCDEPIRVWVQETKKNKTFNFTTDTKTINGRIDLIKYDPLRNVRIFTITDQTLKMHWMHNMGSHMYAAHVMFTYDNPIYACQPQIQFEQALERQYERLKVISRWNYRRNYLARVVLKIIYSFFRY